MADAITTYRDVPPLRKKPFAPDEHDSKRVEYAKRLWHCQDVALRLRDRQIEENIRMLCGQQWSVWSDLLGRFVDVAQLMSEDDLRWRQRPVINKLLGWFILTHARLTENPPILTFLPRSGDKFDAELAEVADTIFKTKWSESGMAEVIDRLVAWLIPGGRAFLKSRIDPRLGDLVTWRGPGMIPVLGEDGAPVLALSGEPMEIYADDAAYDAEGNLVSEGFVDEHGIGYHEPKGKMAHAERKGDLAVDVLAAPEVRGDWGEQTPWHLKRRHMHRSFMTPEDVYELWGIEVEPDVTAGEAGPGELQRLMMGSGFFGAANQARDSDLLGIDPEAARFCSVYEIWERPCPFSGMEETEESPGGRLLIVVGNKVARDGVRTARFKYTSPIRCFDFINVPGRPSGSTPQEALNPVQRAFNRSSSQVMMHAALCADPKPLIHASTGIEDGMWDNEPGVGFVVKTEPGVEPVVYVVPPPLGPEVHETLRFLGETLDDMGHREGARGQAPTRDSSGELVKELRENSDRPIASTSRRMVQEFGRLAEDWLTLLPTVMDEEDVISYAGEDEVLRTITVYPELFKRGQVNVSPDVESMLPEGRGERQARVERMWLSGAFGDPLSPEARAIYLERARFPHLTRDALPGGIHRITAKRENGMLARGLSADEIPVFPWYDDVVHLMVLEEWMASPEWVQLAPEVQANCAAHRDAHLNAVAAKAAKMMAEQAEAGLLADEAGANAADRARPLPAQPEGESPTPAAASAA